MRHELVVVGILATACGSGIEKEPQTQTIYVVVNNSNGTSGEPNNGTGQNGEPNNSSVNNGAPNNSTINNGTPNNATPNNATPNNATPNNATPNNATPNNGTPNNTNTNNVTNNTPAGDACDNPADIEALSNPQFPYTQRDCALNCFSTATPRECNADCAEMNVGTSPECSLCVADLSLCGTSNCFAECATDPLDSACLACLEICRADFVACGGVDLPGAP